MAIAIEAAAVGPAPALPPNAAVLVLGDAALARAARELANKAYKVNEASSVEAALEILAAEEIAALVCDLDLRAADPGALLRVLKKQSPQTQLITVTETSDSETIIRLINEARIYRFLKKPVNFSLLQNALLAALSRYARLVRSPTLVRTESAKAGQTGRRRAIDPGAPEIARRRFAAAFKS